MVTIICLQYTTEPPPTYIQRPARLVVFLCVVTHQHTGEGAGKELKLGGEGGHRLAGPGPRLVVLRGGGAAGLRH